jgi:tripartite-type tricarboxylate transporter receptor subunit TctC
MDRATPHRYTTLGFFTAALLFALAQGVLLSGHAAAQTGAYPNRPIRIIVPVPPGGGNDYLARIIGERLAVSLGQPVLVENRPGSGGNIATAYVAAQPADGYTLLIQNSGHVISPALYLKLPFDPIRDFDAVSPVASIPFVLVVHPSVAATSVQELVRQLKAKPGSIAYGSSGKGTPQHLSGEWFNLLNGVDMLHVPYKGAGPLVTDLLAGQVQAVFGAMNSLLPHIRSGKLRALGATTSKRIAQMPELPTIMESGVPEFSVEPWYGFIVAAGTPKDIITRLNTEIVKIVGDPVLVREKFTPLGFDPLTSSPAQFMDMMKSEVAQWAKVVKGAGIKPE